jgi:predicted NAD/FAD-binding protein
MQHIPICEQANRLFTAELRDVRTSCAVVSVESVGAAGPVCVRTADGKTEQFDKVVLATHSDISLALLGSTCPQVVQASSPCTVQVACDPCQQAQQEPQLIVRPIHMQDVRDVLAAIPYNENDVWLHTDASLMPHSRTAWASWNFMGRCHYESR